MPGCGDVNARIMFIGQAPGRNEDIKGIPFVGISGKLLDRLIISAGLKREDLYITSLVQFFPPDNRMPTKEEIKLCTPFLIKQINLIKPKIVVLLGAVSSNAILGVKETMKIHGKPVKIGNTIYLPTLHPAAAVRLKKNVPLIEEDFRTLGKLIKTHS